MESDSRIAVCGDPHGDLAGIRHACEHRNVAAVIVLGDFGLDQPLDAVLDPIIGERRLHWILGNHDGDSPVLYDAVMGSRRAQEADLNARVVNLGGVRVAGLGGVFRGKIWFPPEAPRYQTRADWVHHQGRRHLWRGGISCRHRVSIWPEDVEALRGEKADVLVTHEAPSCHKHGFAVIDELAESLGVSVIFHGHHHRDYEARLENGIRVIGVGRGGATSLTGERWLPGNLEPESLSAGD